MSCFVLGNLFQPVHAGEIQNRGLGMDVDIFNEKGFSIKNIKGEIQGSVGSGRWAVAVGSWQLAVCLFSKLPCCLSQ